MPPLILFCADPLEPRQPDQAFSAEAETAERLCIERALIDIDALIYEKDAASAVRRVAPRAEEATAVYRGWMLKPAAYAALYDALAVKKVRLINDPTAYRHCHHLPESYAAIEGRTPQSVWTKFDGELQIDQIMALLRPFGSAPLVLKDFVKSRKHEWHEACFIPSASDADAVERIVRRFLELQEEDLNEGLVFREFVEFEPLAVHSKSGMPLTKEFRVFFLDQQPVFWTEYWAEGEYGGATPPIDPFREMAARIASRFFTMDIAKRRNGEWMIVELGDAQVAGLPENADTEKFYRAINER